MNAEDTGTGNAPQTEQNDGLVAVGKRLAAAREDQERKLASVASDLHLNLEMVTALEAGDESALPAMTFVRGYIKSYARLLGLDEKQLLALLPVSEGYRPAPLKSVGMHRRPINLHLGKWLVWLIVLAVLGTLVVYGVPVVERLLNRAEPTLEPGALPLPLGEAPAEIDGGLAPELPAGVAEPLPIEEAPEPSVPAEAGTGKAAAPAAVPLGLPEVPKVTPETTQSAGPAEITLRFSEDSWVEMESHGRKLVVGMQPAGSERTVRAEPPVQILLGNAPGVAIEYRGKLVDLKPHQRGKVARLVLED